MTKLTDKQRRFCDEYLIDLNGTQAAIRAGYSKKSAMELGYQLLQKTPVQEYVQQLKKERSKRTEVTADRALQELARIGFSDIRRTIGANDRLLDPSEWDDDTAAAIASLEVVQSNKPDEPIEHTHKIKTWDKNSALEKLCKHLGIYAADPANQLNFKVFIAQKDIDCA